MRRGAPLAVALGLVLAACTTGPAPSASGAGPSGASATVVPATCAPDLPERTSPSDVPLAILHAAGDDLPPVTGEIEWDGAGGPVATAGPEPIHGQRFTVLQTRSRGEISIRMTDGVEISDWVVTVLPNRTFRAGDYETGREVWSEGSGREELICIPIVDGQWLVTAELTFADDLGGGTYYWRLNVTETPQT